MNKYHDLALQIVEAIGGESNVKSVVHCATRLRFVVSDKTLVDKAVLGKIKGVLGVVESGGQIQVVIGNAVPDVYQAIGENKRNRLRRDGYASNK